MEWSLTNHPVEKSLPQIGHCSLKSGAVQDFFDINLRLSLPLGTPTMQRSVVALATTHCWRLKAKTGNVRLIFWGFHHVWNRKWRGSEITSFFLVGSLVSTVMGLDATVMQDVESEVIESSWSDTVCFFTLEGGCFVTICVLPTSLVDVFALLEHVKTWSRMHCS